jgi:hypothetical protein
VEGAYEKRERNEWKMDLLRNASGPASFPGSFESKLAGPEQSKKHPKRLRQ